MSAYIGPLGGLVELECPSDLRPTMERPFAEIVTTSGIVRQQVSQRTRRQWDFAVGVATPSEAAQLAAVVAGEFGYGPFWFVDPWAQVTNVMAPAASTLDLGSAMDPPNDMTPGGPVDLADGSRAGRSWVPSNPGAFRAVTYLDGALHRVPVRNGQTVTASVYASGATVDVRMQWFDAAGSVAGVTSPTTHGPGSQMQRLWHFANPPVGVHAATIQVRGATRVARPALTWTSFLADWHVGQGAPSVAIPASLSQDITLATREQRGGRLASVSTTIREVG